MKNLLWVGFPVLTIWVIAIFHRISGLVIDHHMWYTFPLILTYILISVGAIVLATYQLVKKFG